MAKSGNLDRAAPGDLASCLEGRAGRQHPGERRDLDETQFDWALLSPMGYRTRPAAAASRSSFRSADEWTQYGAYLWPAPRCCCCRQGFNRRPPCPASGPPQGPRFRFAPAKRQFRLMAGHGARVDLGTGAEGANKFLQSPWLEFTGHAGTGAGAADGPPACTPIDVADGPRKIHAAFPARAPFASSSVSARRRDIAGWNVNAGVPRYDDQQRFAGLVGSSRGRDRTTAAWNGFSERPCAQLARLPVKLIERAGARAHAHRP
jgi:hypothetical protein